MARMSTTFIAAPTSVLRRHGNVGNYSELNEILDFFVLETHSFQKHLGVVGDRRATRFPSLATSHDSDTGSFSFKYDQVFYADIYVTLAWFG